MKHKYLRLFSAALLVISVFSIANLALAKGSLQGETGSDSNPGGAPDVLIPEMYQPASTLTSTTIKGTPVFFTPQDENTSATILFVYNLGSDPALVGFQTFGIDGALVIDTSFTVPAKGLVRICSDSVSTISATWANYILINMTTFSTYAKLTLPKNVKADGYVAYDSTGTYDPLTEAHIIPLRLSVKNSVP